MAKKKKKKERVQLGDSQPEQFNNPFAALLKNKSAPAAPQNKPTPKPKPPAPALSTTLDLSSCRKLVLRRERKKRKGHTAIVVSGLSFDATATATLAKQMRKALGCGASVEGNTVVIQGDIMDRVEAWLTKKGAPKVIRGN